MKVSWYNFVFLFLGVFVFYHGTQSNFSLSEGVKAMQIIVNVILGIIGIVLLFLSLAPLFLGKDD